MKKLLVSLMLSSAMFLTACGGGGSSKTPVGGGPDWSFEDAAYDFVDSVNRYMYDYDIQIEKLHTQQWNYIVVYDWVTDTYDAYDLTWYNPGENIADYLYDFDAYFYYGLMYMGNNIFEDPLTGTRFNRDSLSLNSFLKEGRKSEAYKAKVTNSIKKQFGLSAETSSDLAQAYIDLTSMPKSQVSATYVDRVAKQAFGFSVSEVEKEIMAGNFGAIDNALEAASAKTGVGADELQSKLKEMFNLDLDLLK
jgi:hypothetical protein